MDTNINQLIALQGTLTDRENTIVLINILDKIRDSDDDMTVEELIFYTFYEAMNCLVDRDTK